VIDGDVRSAGGDQLAQCWLAAMIAVCEEEVAQFEVE
jgi:hypothetical protein